VKLAVGFALLIGAMSFSSSLPAQTPGASSLSETALYSLYARRHVATIAFANLALTRAADGEVRKAAETITRAHRDARESLERVATERHLTLAPPEHDTSTVLLEQARSSLAGKAGRAFDSTWVSLADNWLITLIVDNNRAVKAHIGPELQAIAQAHTTWLFHQTTEILKLRKKFT
jgi:predicted outer membrane protein